MKTSKEEQGINRFPSGTLMEGTSLSVQVQTMMWISFGASTKMPCSMAERCQYHVNLTTYLIFIIFIVCYSESVNKIVSFRESPCIWIWIFHRSLFRVQNASLVLSYKANHYINTIRSFAKLYNTKRNNLFNMHLDIE